MEYLDKYLNSLSANYKELFNGALPLEKANIVTVAELNIRGIIAVGWLETLSQILILTTEAVLIYDYKINSVVMEDLETNINEIFSKDNLEVENYTSNKIKYKCKVFGLRGGNGNHYSRECSLKFISLNPDTNFVFFQNSRMVNSMKYFVPLSLNEMSEKIYGGFSLDFNFALVFGQSWLKIFKIN